MLIKNATFLTSVSDKNKIIQSDLPEIAVAGRSNVGKSSFINLITGQGKLAKTSKEPGRTRLINYFSCNNDTFYLVDLPGYGYASVSHAEKSKWGDLIEGYLQNAKSLKNVFVLLDIRREVSQDDLIMIHYLHHYHISFTLIATKADKLSRMETLKRQQETAARLAMGKDNILITSALKKTGKEEVFSRIEQILQTD